MILPVKYADILVIYHIIPGRGDTKQGFPGMLLAEIKIHLKKQYATTVSKLIAMKIERPRLGRGTIQ